jgi:diacylglycerol kinase family enzyme
MDVKDSYVVIINPRRYPKAVSELEILLRELDASAKQVQITKSKDDFIKTVTDFCHEDYPHILVWGGDGTAHDAINAVVSEYEKYPELPRKSLGFFRGGSGNGIQDSYEVPHDIMRPLEKQIECYLDSMDNNFTIDVDLINAEADGRQSYCQLAGFGFDAEVLKTREARKYKRGPLEGEAKAGMLNYGLSMISTFLWRYATMNTDFTAEFHDGKFVVRGPRTNAEHSFETFRRKTDAPMIEAGTRAYYGTMLKICPDVVCNDGNMNVYIFDLESKWDIVKNFIPLYRGQHDKLNRKFAKKNKPPIERYEVHETRISSPQPFNYHIDGELFTTELEPYDVSLSIVPKAVNFLVPRAFYIPFHWHEMQND